MKQKYAYLFIGTATLIALTFYVYFEKFNGVLSSDSTSWGDFGSYVSGTLGIILSCTSFVFLYLTFNEQQNLTNQQQFESVFFNFLNTHKNIVESTADYDHLIDFSIKEKGKPLFGYELLDYIGSLEQQKMTKYYYANDRTGYHGWLSAEEKCLSTYDVANNHYIGSKEYLITISENIVEIYLYIKKSNQISEETKTLYINLFSRSLRNSEKFFVVLFYLQKKSYWQNKKLINTEDLKTICCNTADAQFFLNKKPEDFFPPFACGLIENVDSGLPSDSFTFKKSELPSLKLNYKVDKFGADTEVEYIEFSIKEAAGYFRDIKIIPHECHSGFYVYFYDILLKKLTDSTGDNPHKELTEKIKKYVDANQQFEISVYSMLNNGQKRFGVYDNINFRFENENIIVSCSPVFSSSKDFISKSRKSFKL